MPKKIQLFIANPCHEQWGDMQPNAEGRFCGSCQKTVVDFTMMSDQEILSRVSGGGRSVCGRFMQGQLNRDLVPAGVLKRRRWVMWWQLLLAGWLISSEASAQMGKVQRGLQIERIVSRNEPATDDGLRIRVIDAVSDEPVAWASVRLGKAQYAADSAGWIRLSRKQVKRGRQMEISAVGYTTTVYGLNDVGKDEFVRVLRLVRAANELPAATVGSYGRTMGKLTITGTTTITSQDVLRDTLAYIGVVKRPFTVYPNPVAKGASVTLSLQKPVPGNYMVQMFDAGGRVIESMRIEGVNGARTELLAIPETAAAGLYFVRLQHEQTGKVYTQKVEVL